MLRSADLQKLVPAVLAGLLLAGCGASSLAPALAPPTSSTTAREAGTARFDVDVESGQVKVTPLDGDAASRAVFTGSTVAFQTTTLVDLPGNSGVRALGVSLTNRSGSPIGRDHLRVVIRHLNAGPSAAAGIRQHVRVTKVNALSGLRGLTFAPDDSYFLARVADHRIYRALDGQLTVWAGRGGAGYVDGAPTIARFNQPIDVIYHPTQQALYVTDSGNHRVRRITANGAVTTVAGTGTAGAADGVGDTATLDGPQFIDVQADGALVVTTADGRVRRITLTGADPSLPASYTVTTVASGLTTPMGIAADPDGILYVAERTAHRIRRIDRNNASSVIVGNGGAGITDGPGDIARLHSPVGLGWAGGALVVADSLGQRMRLVTRRGSGSPALRPSWYVQNIAGSLDGTSGDVVGLGEEALFKAPWGVRARPDGAVILTAVQNSTIAAFDLPAGLVTSGVGDPTSGELVRVSNPSGQFGPNGGVLPFFDYPLPAGSLAHGASTQPAEWWFDVPASVRAFSFIATVEAATVAQVVPEHHQAAESPSNLVQTIIPLNRTARVTEVDGPAVRATIHQSTTGLAVDPDGVVYLASAKTVRRFDPQTNVITTIAGHPHYDLLAPGEGTFQRFSALRGIAAPRPGLLFVADEGDHSIYLLQHTSGSLADSASWSAQRVIGTGTAGVPTGSANSPIYSPRGIDARDERSVWFVDAGHRLCRATAPSGNISDPANWTTTVVAGDSSSLLGTPGDSDSPLSFNSPADVAVSSSGQVYVADAQNNRVRVVGFDGQAVVPYAASAIATGVAGIALDNAGNVFANTFAHGLKRLVAASTSDIVPGSSAGDPGHDGFGNTATSPARPQTVPNGIAVSPEGDLWFIDALGLRRVSRVITSGSP